MQHNDDHIWFQEQLATYLAGGLEGDERARFESHAASCPHCAAELERARADEQRLRELFANATPPPGFEDRIITRLRIAPRRRMWIHPLIVKVAATAAAVGLVGGVGYVASEAIRGGGVGQAVTSSLRQIGQAVLIYSSDAKGSSPRTNYNVGDALDLLLRNQDSASEVRVAPSSNAEKWDFGGGSDTALNWSNWNGTAGIQRNLSYSYAAPASEGAGGGRGNANNHDEDLESILYGDGHVEFQPNPFGGVQRDKIYLGKELTITEGRSAEPSTAAMNQRLTTPTQESFKPNEFAAGAAGSREVDVAPVKRDQLNTVSERLQTQVAGKEILGVAVQPVGQPPTAPAPPTTTQVITRKVIRHGQIEFEVDSFDSSVATITKIVSEESGFIATTNSQKLDNGKVKGMIVVRVPPDRLDTLVLKLRALGELKRQNLSAQDVTKQYTDLESELRAARAMEERLIEIIKTGKGEIKDLLAAEKELANWRGKIEKILGEINYYNNQIALSTLSIDLMERNISSAAAASEQEDVNAGVETDDVESARAEAIKSIDEGKGRIIESELKKLDAGQLAAKIVAEVPPENAGPVIDRLRQLGKIARLDIQRKQTTPSGTTPGPNARVEQKHTRLIISLYNLANVAPRQTSNLNLACADVEAVYRQILARIEKAGGRIVTSGLNQQRPEQTTGSIHFEVKSAEAGPVLLDIRSLGDVANLVVTENPDTANVTTAKHGFVVQLMPQSQIPPRETIQLGIRATNVDSAVAKVTSAATAAGGKVLESNLARESDGKMAARMAIDVPLGKSAEVLDQIKSLGDVRTERSTKNAQVPEGSLSRARIEIALASPQAIVSGEKSVWGSIREGLGTSFAGLMWSLQILVVGLCFVVPWALVLWGGWKLMKRARVARAPSP